MRVQVTAQVDLNQVESTRESYDGDNRALRSEQISEDENHSTQMGGVPGALSNQPPAAATVAVANSAPAQSTAKAANGAPADAAAPTIAVDEPPQSRSSQSTRNYEIDRTIEHTRTAPGSLTRLSVAVVVDDRETIDDKGVRTRAPRDAAELEHLTALVREAVGYNAERGDSVNLVNASFVVQDAIAAAEPTPIWEEGWFRDLVKQGLAALGVLLLVLLVLRPALTKLAANPGFVTSGPIGAGASGLANDSVAIGGRTGGTSAERLQHARSLAQEDPRLVAHVVKQWMDKDE